MKTKKKNLNMAVLGIIHANHNASVNKQDVIVQRQTMHKWRNPSKTKPARMVSVISPAKSLVVAGKELGLEGFSVDSMGSRL